MKRIRDCIFSTLNRVSISYPVLPVLRVHCRRGGGKIKEPEVVNDFKVKVFSEHK